MKNGLRIIYWVARICAAVIMAQTLFFKFSGAEESVYIFTTVGMEPWGRIGVGILELVAAVLLLIPQLAFAGAFLALGLMLGAIGMHLTLLGIVVQDDGGYLFGLAIAVTACSLYVLFINTDRIATVVAAIRRKVS